jgi:hypothetical protein
LQTVIIEHVYLFYFQGEKAESNHSYEYRYNSGT